MRKIVAAYQQKKFLAKNIFSFIHQHNRSDIEQLTTLSKDFRAQLKKDGFYISQIKTVEVFS